jgi:hypothetical protein
LESATHSSRKTGRSMSKCIRYLPRAWSVAALFLIISDDLKWGYVTALIVAYLKCWLQSKESFIFCYTVPS